MSTTRTRPVQRAVQQAARRRTQQPVRQSALWDVVRAQNHAIRQARDGSLLDRFARWLEQNPHLPDLAAGVARELKRRGKKQGSIDYVWNIMLWEHGTRAPSATGSPNPETPAVVELNHDYRAPMSRLLMERYPDLAGYFKTRKSQIDPDEGASSRLSTRRSANPPGPEVSAQ